MTPEEILKSMYILVEKNVKSKKSGNILTKEQQVYVVYVARKAESQKGITTALITSLVKKIEVPTQDVRKHKSELTGGYSGRSFDTKYITPFLKQNFGRIAMKESGWLTRSIEQSHEFSLTFPGKIRDIKLKNAFLRILEDVEVNNADPKKYLLALFELLFQQKISFEKSQATISKSIKSVNVEIVISKIINMLEHHFFRKYSIGGQSRLPVIAIYSIYEVMMNDVKKYEGKQLKELKDHTTSDIKSKELGDVEILENNDKFFESIEIKHDIAVTPDMIRDIGKKIEEKEINRYYLLTTAIPNIQEDSEKEVMELVSEIKETHGCEIIVNGVMNSIRYYLRLVKFPQEFIEKYSNNLIKDFEKNTDVKQEHIDFWNDMLQQLTK